MKCLAPSFLHRIPAIPIKIERRSFDQKEKAVYDEGRVENVCEIIHQLGIERDQAEQQDPAEQGGGRIGGGQQLGEFLGQLVVALFPTFPTYDFTHPRKDRHA